MIRVMGGSRILCWGLLPSSSLLPPFPPLISLISTSSSCVRSPSSSLSFLYSILSFSIPSLRFKQGVRDIASRKMFELKDADRWLLAYFENKTQHLDKRGFLPVNSVLHVLHWRLYCLPPINFSPVSSLFSESRSLALPLWNNLFSRLNVLLPQSTSSYLAYFWSCTRKLLNVTTNFPRRSHIHDKPVRDV